MEKGAQALARMLMIAFLMGLIILFVHPDYRKTLQAIQRGQPELAPLWLSNQSYYSEVHATLDEGEHDTK
jgi:hypothetical protein